MLGLQPIQPDPLLGTPQLRLGTLRHRQVMPGMTPSYARRLTALFQPFQRVLPDRLEHPEARLAVGVFASSDQALGGERLQAIQNVDVEIAQRSQTASAASSGPSAHEDREPTEETPLGSSRRS